MAYQNPENGKIYLNMKMAPVCALHNSINPCIGCKILHIAQKHHVDGRRGMPCQDTCELYGDEVAEAYGYKKIEYTEHESNRVNSNGNPDNYRICDQIGDTIIINLDSTKLFTHSMILQCIRDRVNSNGIPVNYRIGDQIGDTIIIDLDTLYFDDDGIPYAYGKDPNNMDQYGVNYRLDRFKTVLNQKGE